VPPPAQGAFIAEVRSVSPAPAGKSCPSGAAFTYDVPDVTSQPIPPKGPETLTALRYLHKIIDGEDSSTVACTVSGGSTFRFSGKISLAGKGIEITGGTLGADKKGTASITVSNSVKLSSPLAAPTPNCTIDAAPASDNNFQVRPGSMWASYSCPNVEHAPSDYCKADGFFVLENCSQ
jgi:hypothetical protein